jgi:drug/metabolite transporter (DMT)-like permease
MHREQMLKGALYMTIGFFFVAVSGAFVKAANALTSSLWVIFIAYSFACVIQFFVNLPKGFAFLKTTKPFGHCARIVFGTFSTLLYAYSIKHIPLLNATLLFNTTPLFVPIFAILILKNKVPLKIWASLLFGFIGVAIILHPDVALLNHPGNIVGLASGLFQAITFIIVKILTKSEPVERINFYFFLGSSIILGPLAYFLAAPPPMESVLWSLCAGAISFISQYFVVSAYQCADASHIGAFQYTSVIFAGLIGWLIWDQTPNFYDLIGILCVMLGGILAITLYHLKTPKKLIDE